MRILGIAGTKEAGKTSLAKYLFGYKMLELGLTEDFSVNENGELLVNFEGRDSNGQITRWLDIFDIESKLDNVLAYLDTYVHPTVKIYNFADPLKELLMRYFDVSYDAIYKNKKLETPIKLISINKLIPKEIKGVTNLAGKNCNGREALQYIAKIIRTIDNEAFVRDTINRIHYENTEFAIVADVRTFEEVNSIKANGGKVIYLKKHTHNDRQKIENELSTLNEDIFDFVIDNTEMTPNECHITCFNEIKKWGWI